MPSNIKLNRYLNHFIGFTFVGLFITIISYLLTILLIEIVAVNILMAYPAVYIISILASYYLNRDQVFKYNGKNRFIQYFIIYLTSMLLGLLLITAIKWTTEISDTVIAIMVLPITTIYNFILVSLLFNNKN